MFNPYGLMIVFLGIACVAIAWKGTYKQVWEMVKGSQ